MPAINAASSSSSAASIPVLPGSDANAMIHDGSASGSFAALFQQQVAKISVEPGGAAEELTAAPDPALAAWMTFFFGTNTLAATAVNPTTGPESASSGKTGQDGREGFFGTDPGVLPTIIAGTPAPAPVVAADTPVKVSPEALLSAGRSGYPLALPSADPMARAPDLPAIVAAEPEAAAIPVQMMTEKDGFSELLADAKNLSASVPLAAHTHGSPVDQPAGAQRIQAAVGTSGWSAEMGDRLVWMSNSQQSRAELVLTPPELGRVEVSISMNGDQANAIFVSANPAVRDALEGALPRLREILADAGLTLGQAQVNSESAGQSARERENGDNSGRNAAMTGDAERPEPVVSGVSGMRAAGGRGLVDVFA